MKLQHKSLILLNLLVIVAVGCVLSRNQSTLPKAGSSSKTSPETPRVDSGPQETAPEAPEEPVADGEPEDTQYGDDHCTIAFPKPALKPDLSKNRYAVEKKDTDLIETVTQESGVRLVVTQGGCVDAAVIGFEFSASAKDFPKMPEQQLAWVRDRLKEINCVGYRCEMADTAIDRIGKYLHRIEKAPADTITKSKLTICHDGTIEGEPAKCRDSDGNSIDCDNYCSWYTGGSTQFEVKSDGKGVTLSLVEARSA